MLIVMVFLMASDSIESRRLQDDGQEACGLYSVTRGLKGPGGGATTVKTMIAFHQLRPIFYTSLKQSNLQVDNYALALFYLVKGERCRGTIAAAVLPSPGQITRYRSLFAITAGLGNQLTSSSPPSCVSVRLPGDRGRLQGRDLLPSAGRSPSRNPERTDGTAKVRLSCATLGTILSLTISKMELYAIFVPL